MSSGEGGVEPMEVAPAGQGKAASSPWKVPQQGRGRPHRAHGGCLSRAGEGRIEPMEGASAGQGKATLSLHRSPQQCRVRPH